MNIFFEKLDYDLYFLKNDAGDYKSYSIYKGECSCEKQSSGGVLQLLDLQLKTWSILQQTFVALCIEITVIFFKNLHCIL